jgi:hypothetical protein
LSWGEGLYHMRVGSWPASTEQSRRAFGVSPFLAPSSGTSASETPTATNVSNDLISTSTASSCGLMLLGSLISSAYPCEADRQPLSGKGQMCKRFRNLLLLSCPTLFGTVIGPRPVPAPPGLALNRPTGQWSARIEYFGNFHMFHVNLLTRLCFLSFY